MRTIKWSAKSEIRNNPANADHDWCGKYNGKYVDLIRSVDGTWTCLYDNKVIEFELPSREVALQKLIDFLVDK